MTVPITSSLTIQFDGALLKCEAVGRNGSRRKIDLGSINDDNNWELIKTELLAQLEIARDRARNELMETQRNNIQYVAETQPQGIAFAKKIWGADWVSSRVLKSRLAKAGQFDPDLGRIRENDNLSKKTKETLDLGEL